jgi:DNA-binding CsgD family transcriptional regulator
MSRAVMPVGWQSVPIDPEGGGPVESLSVREREVLELTVSGMRNREIAERLMISSNTVKFHLRKIYSRLGVHNRVQAARAVASVRDRQGKDKQLGVPLVQRHGLLVAASGSLEKPCIPRLGQPVTCLVFVHRCATLPRDAPVPPRTPRSYAAGALSFVREVLSNRCDKRDGCRPRGAPGLDVWDYTAPAGLVLDDERADRR